MPRYDYVCPSCDLRFEIERSINDRTEVLCPSCATPARKVFSPSAVVLKGSGFHNTDYRPRPASDDTPAVASSCPAAGSGEGCAGCSAH